MSDIVELVMAVEEAFDLEILNEEAEEIGTVGDLHQWLIKKDPARFGAMDNSSEAIPCLTSAAFYQVRRVLVAQKLATRHEVTPKTRLDDLLPPVTSNLERRAAWKEISSPFGETVSHLELPDFLKHGIPLLFFTALCLRAC